MKKILSFLTDINNKFNKYCGWFFINGRKHNPFDEAPVH